MTETKKGYKAPKDVKTKFFHISFSENEIEDIEGYMRASTFTTKTSFIREAVNEKIMRKNHPELFYLKRKDKKEMILKILENTLLQLNSIAWDYVSKKGVLQYKERYYKLQNNTIWFLGLNRREDLDKLKGTLQKDADMSEYSFHHEIPYRKHWHTLFTTGEFVRKHRQGSMKKL